MTIAFDAYSQYYDLLYQDKDYANEADYVRRLLVRFLPSVSNIMELGCGTGRHAALLAESGLKVTGVEVSESMLQQAKVRAAAVSASGASGRFGAELGDARTFRVEERFDAVVSLFHVVSYQISNDDVRQLFKTAATHLSPGGLFLFDVWYGPAVMALRPVVRVKRMENSQIAVLRIAEPRIDMNRNRVDVTYTVLVTDRPSGVVQQFNEEHRMRYYFSPELELIGDSIGMPIIHSEEWMTGGSPSEATWGVTFIARKI